MWIEDSGGGITIGNRNKFCGTIRLASVEGCAVTAGDDNLFSSGISITTTDSHSIIDRATGKRINPSRNVNIGSHNWIGMRSMILKGVSIDHDTIAGAGAVVTKPPGESDCVLAGNPAGIVKREITWDIERINDEDSTNKRRI